MKWNITRLRIGSHLSWPFTLMRRMRSSSASWQELLHTVQMPKIFKLFLQLGKTNLSLSHKTFLHGTSNFSDTKLLKNCLVWARENWDWIKAALGGDMSFDSFVIFPSHIFKTEQRLAEYKAFFEPQLSDLALSRNIRHGYSRMIAARVELIKREKAAVEAVVAQYGKA